MTELTARTVTSDVLRYLSAFAQHQVPSLYIRQGPWACIAAYIALAVLVPSIAAYVAAWVAIELLWMCYFYSYMVPALCAFRPEDSGVAHTEEDVDRIIDNIVFLLTRDSKLFWKRVTGHACVHGKVPRPTAQCFVKSLLFMFDDCDCYNHDHQIALFENALARIEVASGGFLPEIEGKCDNSNGNTTTMPPAIPNHIRSWVDDDHLGSIVRSTPLLMIFFSQLLRMATICVIMVCGFRRSHMHSPSGLECWVWNPSRAADATTPTGHDSRKAAVLRPLVLLPGAGFGLTSFLPLAMFFQGKFSDRTIILYRLPWVEVCRPRVHLPQWSTVMEGMLTGFVKMGIQDCEIDVVSHSYGTAVANRLLRELCKISSMPSAIDTDTANKSSCQKPPRINFLALLDPIVLGGATTGLSGFVINQVGPDLSFAFCGNRAGFSTKEILDYDPRQQGQCMGGIGVYMSENDMLVDVHLARHILENHVVPLATRRSAEDNKFVQFCIDPTDNSFHGRWLVEMWCLGVLWGAPCANRCLGLLEQKLKTADHEEALADTGTGKPRPSHQHDLFSDSDTYDVTL
jgi:pimeloyl-ACP methyl ester carboxylesterase